MANNDRALTKQLLLSSGYWVLNKIMVKMFGLETAFLLSSFAEAEQMLADESGRFYQTSETVEKVTTLSRHKQDRCLKELLDKGILIKTIGGQPPKRYFQIDYECLTNLFVNYQQMQLRENDKYNCEKSATNKEPIDIELTDKEPNYNNDHLPKKKKDLEEEKHSANFERFWGIYPKKVAKQKAKDIWLQKKYDDLLTEKIIDAITQQVEVTWKGTEKQYIPNATTWLNQQRWEDEIIKSPPPQNNRRTPAQSERERIKDPSEYDHPTNANAYARAWFEKQQALAAKGGEDHA